MWTARGHSKDCDVPRRRFSILPCGRAYRAGVGELHCADGSVLTVDARPCRDRGGAPYEIVLVLRRDGVPFGSVGERCGYVLATLAARLAAARTPGSRQARCWPDPDDRFPDPALDSGLRAAAAGRDADLAAVLGALAPYLPRERELFTLRRRDRDDAAGSGELRCTLRTSSRWVSGAPSPVRAGRGAWRLARRAVVEAWGTGGHGVRAVLTSGQLAGFITGILDAAECAGASYRDLIDGTLTSGSGR